VDSIASTPTSLIMRQFLGWLAERPRTDLEIRQGWHSCPHISVWEDALVDGLVCIANDGSRTVVLTARGRRVLAEARKQPF
jgi:hypothetical protein